jgi:hypothetical protein
MIQFRPIIGNIGGGSKEGMEIVGRDDIPPNQKFAGFHPAPRWFVVRHYRKK